MKPRYGDLAQFAMVVRLSNMAFVRTSVGSFAMVDGTVTGISLCGWRMKLRVSVMMDRVMETLNGDHIQKVVQQKKC